MPGRRRAGLTARPTRQLTCGEEVLMVPVLSLWLPILVSAVFVFVVSSFIHMVLPYHHKDYRKLDKEDEYLALETLSLSTKIYTAFLLTECGA